MLGSSQASHHHQTSFAHWRIGWCEIGYYLSLLGIFISLRFWLLLLLLHASLISLSRAEAAVIRTLGFSNYSVSAMKKQRQNVSESGDLLAVNKRNTRSKTSTDGGENSEPLPVDLLVDIFLRLPLKSIATSRCVSKLWASVLRLPYFTELFLTRPCARPHLLFSCLKDRHVLFFSSPEPQSLDKYSSPLTASYLMKIPYAFLYERRIRCIRGLVFFIDEQNVNGKMQQVSVICNPSTKQTLTLPKVKSRRRIGVRSYFGYDPIDKQHKVLAMTWKFCGYDGYPRTVSEEHQVLTLGTNKPSWKRIECCIPHSPHYEDHNICINGVLYYRAVSSRDFIIVCFDVNAEKFSFVKDTYALTTSSPCAPLINYKGKLGSILFGGSYYISGSIKVRVLEDAEKHKWSEHIFVWPASWKNIETWLYFVKVTQTNEIVLARSFSNVLFYNTEGSTIREVEIHGMEEEFKNGIVYTFGDHVEDVKLI